MLIIYYSEKRRKESLFYENFEERKIEEGINISYNSGLKLRERLVNCDSKAYNIRNYVVRYAMILFAVTGQIGGLRKDDQTTSVFLQNILLSGKTLLKD